MIPLNPYLLKTVYLSLDSYSVFKTIFKSFIYIFFEKEISTVFF